MNYSSVWYPFKPIFRKGEKLKHYTFTKQRFDSCGNNRIKEILDREGFKHPVFLHTIKIFSETFYDFITYERI